MGRIPLGLLYPWPATTRTLPRCDPSPRLPGEVTTEGMGGQTYHTSNEMIGVSSIGV